MTTVIIVNDDESAIKRQKIRNISFSAEKQENAFSPNKQAVNFKRFHLFI
jgi:hypothetical protein